MDGSIVALCRSYLKSKTRDAVDRGEHLDLALLGSASFHRAPIGQIEITPDVTPGQLVDAALRQTTIRDMVIEDTPLEEVIRALYADAERINTARS